MNGHARLGPSNHRWPHCPGSIREEKAYPDIPGAAAIDGTGSHELLEICLKNGVRAESYDGQIIGANHPDNPMGWLVSVDRTDRVQECLDYVQRRYDELSEQFPGMRVTTYAESLSYPGTKIGRDDWWGTVDITIEVDDPSKGDILFIEVIDYKDGRSWVNVKGNTQLLSYLIGKIDMDSGIYPCRITIVQPKTNPSIRYDDVSVGDIRFNFQTLKAAAFATDDPNAPLVSGDHCTWCKHGRAKNCTAKSEQSLERMTPMTENVTAGSDSLFEIIEQTFGDITAMSSDKLEELADAKAGLMEVFERVDIELQRRVEDPDDNTVTGYAMLPGRGSQSWSEDEETIVKMLKARRLKKDEIYPAKLITPAAALKLSNLTKDQKEKIQKNYIEKTAGKSTLQKVRQSEPTEAAVMFADVAKPKISFI